MPQLKADEWPAENEPTTTEREVTVSKEEADAAAEFRKRRSDREPAHGRDAEDRDDSRKAD